MLAETGRSVVVTIHQPRSEIFHSFDKILLLCRGQVAYFGSPVKVWDFFTHALDYEDESLVSLEVEAVTLMCNPSMRTPNYNIFVEASMASSLFKTTLFWPRKMSEMRALFNQHTNA